MGTALQHVSLAVLARHPSATLGSAPAAPSCTPHRCTHEPRGAPLRRRRASARRDIASLRRRHRARCVVSALCRGCCSRASARRAARCYVAPPMILLAAAHATAPQPDQRRHPCSPWRALPAAFCATHTEHMSRYTRYAGGRQAGAPQRNSDAPAADDAALACTRRWRGECGGAFVRRALVTHARPPRRAVLSAQQAERERLLGRAPPARPARG